MACYMLYLDLNILHVLSKVFREVIIRNFGLQNTKGNLGGKEKQKIKYLLA